MADSNDTHGMSGRVAVLGLGTMGSGMARRLLGADIDLTLWNRSPQRTKPFEGTSARIASTPEDAVADAAVVLTMLFDASAVREVMTRALPAIPHDAIWMQSSTVGTTAAASLAQLAEQAGVRFVDAPVLGTKQPAEQGTLVALLAGTDVDIDALDPVLRAVSSRQLRVGPAAPAASALKLAVNSWIATITAGIAQSLTIAQRLGVDPELVLTALDGTAPDSPYAQLKGHAVLKGNFEPQFEVLGLLKDVRLAMAETPTVPQELLRALEGLYATAAASGSGKEDIAAVWKAFQR